MKHLRTMLFVVGGLICDVVAPHGAIAQIVGGQFAATGSDTASRLFHAAGTLPDGWVMVSGGLGVSGFPPALFSRNQIAFYNPHTGTFSASYPPINGGAAATPTLATPRSSHTQTTLRSGVVLITGGDVGAAGTNPGTPTSSVELFDPFTGVRRSGPPMNTPRSAHTATLLRDGRVLVAGAASCQIFDPASETWSAAVALQRTRVAHAAALLPDDAGSIGDRVLLVGGAGSGPATLELVTLGPLATQLSAATLAVGVDDVAATRLIDDRVLIVGGQNVATGDTVATASLYDAQTDTITPLAPVPNRSGGIADHQLIRFGRYVAIFGGEQQLAGTDTILRYAAIFDGLSHAWIADGQMLNPHDDFAAAPLGDCRALLIGGGVPLLGQEFPSANCETFEITLSGACVPGDVDNDGDVDAGDLRDFGDCMTGPGGGPVYFRCWPADADADDDVDLLDFSSIQRGV
ncbi:MAG: Kelch repeat-containing protein [Phycisphaerae bacterium]